MSFETLGLMPRILETVSKKGYAIPTPIQSKAIPAILKGRDVLGGAQTGTGKTAAFALPVLHRLEQTPRTGRSPRVLVLTPTRELATQVYQSFLEYGDRLQQRTAVVFGGVGITPQISQLKRGIDILVACPGRLLDHARQGTVDLAHVNILILDEADRMLDMGFIHDIRKVLALLKSDRQNLLFSATYSDDIRRLSKTVLNNPEMIEVAPRNVTADGVQQTIYAVSKQDKRHLLSHLIKDEQWSRALVFTRTKHGANRLAGQLIRDGISAAAIHGNKSQSARTTALANFKSSDVRVLVATDIAARGLDIDQLPHVVNFELPHVPEDYVHRIGRTGRAGSEGKAVSLVCEEEGGLLRQIERLLNKRIPRKIQEGFASTVSLDGPNECMPPSGQRRSRSNQRNSSKRRGPDSRQRRGYSQRNASRDAGGSV